MKNNIFEAENVKLSLLELSYTLDMEINVWKQIENEILTKVIMHQPCCSYFADLTTLYRRTWESRVFHATEGFIEPVYVHY